MTTAKLFAGTKLAWLSLLAYFAGILAGGIVGFIGGVPVGLKINRRLGLRKASLP
jgi:hypothetical protein